MVHDTADAARECDTHSQPSAREREPLPPAEPGESLRLYVARTDLLLRQWLDETRRWRRRAEWERIRAAVEAAYGEPVAQRTLETYVAANRAIAAKMLAQVPPSDPEPTPVPQPTRAMRARTDRVNHSRREGANGAGRFAFPRC